MKTLLKILMWIGIVIVLIVAGVSVYILLMWNQKHEAPLPDIHASKDSAIIARGEYLAYGPMHCAECHGTKEDFEAFMAGNKVPFRGGFEFKLPFGTVYSKNLTPDPETGLGNVSDQLIARTLRHGVKSDGTTLIPFMEYQNISDEDLTALVSFLKSLPPVKHEFPKTSWTFMGKAILTFFIKPAGPEGTPPKSVTPDTTAEYGSYLANYVSDCKGCHTKRSNTTGAYIGELYAGGSEFDPASGDPSIMLVSPNITTDSEFGRLAKWNQQQFIDRFRQGLLIKESVMPWVSFQRYGDNDLKAIYKFLTSVPPQHSDPGPVLVQKEK